MTENSRGFLDAFQRLLSSFEVLLRALAISLHGAARDQLLALRDHVYQRELQITNCVLYWLRVDVRGHAQVIGFGGRPA